MRLSDLIGRDVVTAGGEPLGRVNEVLLVQDGPILSETAAAFRVHALAVGNHKFGARLGFFQGTVAAPALLRRVFLRRSPTMVPWGAIVSLDEGRVVVDERRVGDTD